VTPHNEAAKGDYAATVLLPGDPQRVYGLSMPNELAPNTQNVGSIHAISAETGRTIWKHEQRAGMLSLVATGGGLVFGGDASGRFMAFDDKTGNASFTVGDAPVLGLGEGGQQPGRGGGPAGIQFDRRGRLDVMRPGWGSGTLGSMSVLSSKYTSVGSNSTPLITSVPSITTMPGYVWKVQAPPTSPAATELS
jgi:hypothetical protein